MSTDISTTFNIVSSIATAVSAVLVYITLREMKKQRDTEYRPIIVIESREEVEFSSKNGIVNPERKAKVKTFNGHKMKVMKKGSETLIFKVKNIGRGPADKIQYKINESDLIHLFEIEAKNNTNFYFDNEYGSKRIRYGLKNRDGFSWMYYAFQTRSYLLPDGTEDFEIHLPYPVIDILSRSLQNGYSDSLSEFDLHIEFKYEDIQQNHFSKTILISFCERFYMQAVADSNGDIPEKKREKSALYRIDLQF